MADIFSLKESISNKSDEAIDALIQERRANRRTVQAQSSRKSSRSKSKKTKKSKNPKKDIMASLASMSEEEKRKLKEMLQ